MPEGPELYKAAQFLNKIASSHTFTSVRLLQSPSPARPQVPWTAPHFSLSANSRGKEIRITLQEDPDNKAKSYEPQVLNVLLSFGMTGRFAFTKRADVQKHSMLMFDTTDDHTFSFVDSRHFGRWSLSDGWSSPAKRGPCIISEYPEFRDNVLASLDKYAFSKPICELLLEQRYFSCIGNYLRAEVLHRLDIDPYLPARDVLQDLPAECDPKQPDILLTCHTVCWEVVNLAGSGRPYDPEGLYGDQEVFERWLRCYMQEGMGNTIDNKKRTMWHDKKYGGSRKIRHVKVKKEEAENGVSPKKKGNKLRRVKTLKNEPAVKAEEPPAIKCEMKTEPWESPKAYGVKRQSFRIENKKIAELMIKSEEHQTALNAKRTKKGQKKDVRKSPYFDN